MIKSSSSGVDHQCSSASAPNTATGRDAGPQQAQTHGYAALRQPGVLSALTSALLFGKGTPLAKLLLHEISPWMMAGLLYAGSSLGLWFYRRLGDHLTWPLILAAALMSVGVWLHLTEHHVHEHVHAPLEHTHAHEHDEHHQHEHDGTLQLGTSHSHGHRHLPIKHRHVHFPDDHHRHDH